MPGAFLRLYRAAFRTVILSALVSSAWLFVPGAPLAQEPSMTVKEAQHFLVRFEGSDNAVSGHLIGLLLEEAYYKVGADLAYWPAERIEAFLYSEKTFYDVTKSPSWAGALYDGRIKIPAGGVVERTADLERVVFHEYTHALVHALSAGRAPTWLNEGIAQYEEGREAGAHKDYLRELAAEGTVSLKELEGPFTALNPDGAFRAYLLSLSATEYIVREFGLSSVKRVIEGLGQGLDLEGSIRSSLHLSYEDLEESWLGYLRR